MVDTPDSSGRTPLSYSASTLDSYEAAYLSTCKLLVDNGAKVDTLDSSGHNPYWHAEQAGNKEFSVYFPEIGGQESTSK